MNPNGYRAMHKAASGRYLSVVNILIATGAEVDMKALDEGWNIVGNLKFLKCFLKAMQILIRRITRKNVIEFSENERYGSCITRIAKEARRKFKDGGKTSL
jgi:hypothetical protein